MAGENLHDLAAFVAVAEERSFTRAAAKLGVSQSALSQTVRGLEARLGIRLLTRTTRSVAPTEAGERLLRTVAPRFEEINAELAALSELRDKPAGTIRITSTENAAEAVLWPALRTLPAGLPGHQGGDRHRLRPDRHRRGAARCRRPPRRDRGKGHDRGPHRAGHAHGGRRLARLLRRRPPPQTPQDLTVHDCINLRTADPCAASTPGSSSKEGASSRSGSTGSSCSTTAPYAECGSGRLRPGLSHRGAGAAVPRRWPACPGARELVPSPFPATTSTIRAAANLRRPLPCWSMRFVIAKRRGMHEFLSGCRSSKPNVPIRRNVRFQGITQLPKCPRCAQTRHQRSDRRWRIVNPRKAKPLTT